METGSIMEKLSGTCCLRALELRMLDGGIWSQGGLDSVVPGSGCSSFAGASANESNGVAKHLSLEHGARNKTKQGSLKEITVIYAKQFSSG
jgi:hypothetical protein